MNYASYLVSNVWCVTHLDSDDLSEDSKTRLRNLQIKQNEMQGTA